MQKYQFQVGEEDIPSRLDNFLSGKLEGRSRSFIQKLIEEGQVKVCGRPAKQGYRLKRGEVVDVIVPPPREDKALPEEISLDILYEDEHLIAVNKPAGMVVHPGAGNYSGTLVNALLNHCRDLSGIGGVMRPGIVHRLDKGTSGVIVAAKSDEAHIGLAVQFKGRTVEKEYLALVFGKMPHDSGVFKSMIGRHPVHRQKISSKAKKGRYAETYYHVEKQYDKMTLLKLIIKTGRTHQIRVHLSEAGHPIVGDAVYGGRRLGGVGRPMLHSHRLVIEHPVTGKRLEFIAPVPEEMEEMLKCLSA